MGLIGVILTACAAAAALAQDTSDSALLHHHFAHEIPGHCHSPIRRSSFPLLSTPVCANDTLTTKYQASATHPAWTRASGCTANANGTDEFCVFTSATFSRGRGISIITSPQRADYFAQLPAFDPRTSEAVLRDENHDVFFSAEDGEDDDDVEGGNAQKLSQQKFELRHVPGKDMGVVATRPIYRGEHLMSFTPAVIIDYAAFDGLEKEDVRALQTEAVDLLPEKLRERYMALSTHDGASDHVERVDKILKTNAFDLDISDDSKYGLFVVFPESKCPVGVPEPREGVRADEMLVSRFNHDCRPNADYWFDPETLVQHIYATRPIYPGEEISVTYME